MSWAGPWRGRGEDRRGADRRRLRVHCPRGGARLVHADRGQDRRRACTIIWPSVKQARLIRRTGRIMKSDRGRAGRDHRRRRVGDHPGGAARAARHRLRPDRWQRARRQGRCLFDDRARAPAQRPRRRHERLGRRAGPFRASVSKREGGDARGFRRAATLRALPWRNSRRGEWQRQCSALLEATAIDARARTARLAAVRLGQR